jgi:hypothetical protein
METNEIKNEHLRIKAKMEGGEIFLLRKDGN